MKTHHFHTKLACQKSMLRQRRCSVQNGHVTKNGVWPATTLFFLKILFQFKNLFQRVIWCNNDPNAHIRTFCKCWSFIWGCFFTVSILKSNLFFSLICGQHFLIYSFVVRMIVTARGVYRTLSNIYDGDFLRKKIAGFRRFVPNFATDRENRSMVGRWV